MRKAGGRSRRQAAGEILKAESRKQQAESRRQEKAFLEASPTALSGMKSGATSFARGLSVLIGFAIAQQIGNQPLARLTPPRESMQFQRAHCDG